MLRRALYLLLLLTLPLTAASLLTGCGQKGSLYLPDPAPQADHKAGDKKRT